MKCAPVLPVMILGRMLALMPAGTFAAEPIALRAADGASGDAFGQAVAMAGGITAIGAPGADAIYVYERGGGLTNFGMINKLAPGDAAGTRFGSALGLDGDILAVGAPTGAGATYVFRRDSTLPDNWRFVLKLTGSAEPSAAFGRAIAMSGNRLAVGAPGEDGANGALYIFERDEGGPEQWGQVARILCPDKPAVSDFGHSVALAGHTLAVGATAGANAVVYIFQWSTNGIWSLLRRIEPPADGHEGTFFGQALATTSDQLVIGSRGQNGPGAAYIHLRNRGGTNAWGLARTLSIPGSATNDGFGASVALFDDKVVVGAPGAPVDDFGTKGQIFAFSRNQGGRGQWGLLQTYASPDATPLNGQDFGRAVAILGARFVAGAPLADGPVVLNQGAAYAFDLPLQVFSPAFTLENKYILAASEDLVVAVEYVGEGSDANIEYGNVIILERNHIGPDPWRVAQVIEKPAKTIFQTGNTSPIIAQIWGDTLILVSTYTTNLYFETDEIRIYDRQGDTANWRLTKNLVFNRLSEDHDPFERIFSLSGDLLAVANYEPPADPSRYSFLVVITNWWEVSYAYTGECAGVYTEPIPECEDSLVAATTNWSISAYLPCDTHESRFTYPVSELAPYLDRIETNWFFIYKGLIQRETPNPLAAHKLVLIRTNDSDEVEYYYANSCADEWPEPEPLDGQEDYLLRVETNSLPDGSTALTYIYINQCENFVWWEPVPGLEPYLMTTYCGLIHTGFLNELFTNNLVLVTTNGSTEDISYYYANGCDEFATEFRWDGFDDFLLRIETNNLPDGSTNLVYVYSGMCEAILADPPIPGLETYRAMYYSDLVTVGFSNTLFADHLVLAQADGYGGTNYYYSDGCEEFPSPFFLGSWLDAQLLRIETNSLPDGSTNLVYVYSDLCQPVIAEDPIPGLEAYGTPCYTGLVVLGYANPLTASSLVLVTTNIVDDLTYYYANGCEEFPSSGPLEWEDHNLLRIETNSLPDGATNLVYVYSGLCDCFTTNRPIPGLEAFINQPFDLSYVYHVAPHLSPGEVYIFQRHAGGSNQWGLAATLKASDSHPEDLFGMHISLDGDTLFIRGDDSDCSSDSNAWVYVFRRDPEAPNGWREINKILAGDEPLFTLCGDTVILSDWQEELGGLSVRERNAGGPDNWDQVMVFPENTLDFAKLDNQRIFTYASHGQEESGWVTLDIYDRNPDTSGTWRLTQSLGGNPLDLEVVLESIMDFAASSDGDLLTTYDVQLGDDPPDGSDNWDPPTTGVVSRIYELSSLAALSVSYQGTPLTTMAAASPANGTDFGMWKEGATVDRVFTLRNDAEHAALSVGPVTTNGPGAGYFEVRGMPATIAPGTASNFTVRLHANAEGNANAFLRIESADPASPFILNLQAQVSGVHDVSEHLAGGNVNWVFNYVRGTFLGTLTLCLPETYERRLIEPYWYLMESNAYHWLRFPTGRLTNGLYYLDLTRQITNQLPGIGNGDAFLDAGECVTATNIELMGRRDCTGFVWAVWADPPPTPAQLDSDGDGLPDAYEKSFFGLNPYNNADAAKDVDRDGMTAWEEWVAGTDPSLAASVLAMKIQVRPDGGVDVSWPTVTGRTYVVESGLDGWAPLPNSTPAGTDPLPASGFFRVRATLQNKGTTP